MSGWIDAAVEAVQLRAALAAAQADNAALREALEQVLARLPHILRYQQHAEYCGTNGREIPRGPMDDSEPLRGPPEACDCWRAIIFAELSTASAALSTPSPGAPLLERLKKAEEASELLYERFTRDLQRQADDLTAPCNGLGCKRCSVCVQMAEAERDALSKRVEALEEGLRGIETMASISSHPHCRDVAGHARALLKEKP